MGRLDADVAKLFRWIALPIATLFAVVGFVAMPLLPNVGDPTVGEYIFRLAPVMIAVTLSVVAAWMRSREAEDPANEGIISRSLFRHFAFYAITVMAISILVQAILYR